MLELVLNSLFLLLLLGRNNIVSGVAKTIKAHFEKHPLAIVNVKGRAKGTSVREVVLKLEVCMPAQVPPTSLSPLFHLHYKLTESLSLSLTHTLS